MDPWNDLAPGVEVVKCTCAPVVRRIKYLRLQENTTILTRKIKNLIAHEANIRRDISRAEVQRRMASHRALALLDNIEKVKDQAIGVATSLEENKSCFFNCCSRLKLAKRVAKVTQEVDRLLEETSQFANELVVEQSPPRAEVLVAPSLVGDSTVERNCNAILESLRNPVIGKIGIYGMGGSGKTTTMKKINNQLAETAEFDKIIWVTVSKDLNLDKVQNNISQTLNLDLSISADQECRAGRLCERLKQTKFLLIFDDVWDRIPLEKVGIPEPDMENKCKIVLTTRSLTVCNVMETDTNIKMELLSKKEAWDLFVRKVGNQVLTLEMKPFAEEVVRQCGGLPLAINTVGRALRNEVNTRVWRKAVKDLKTSPTDIRGMEDEVLKLLHFSYTRLKNETVQKCFLYCALFPEDYILRKKEWIMFWMAENFINEEGDLETNIDQGHQIWKELTDACMIDHWGGLHDCLRDLAIKIMVEEGGLLVKAGLQLTESPNENEWENATRISLIQNKIEILPEQLNCPNLSTLLLRSNPLSRNISCLFFDKMPALQVLDLSETGITELPASLSNLLNLRILLLQLCTALVKIPSVAKLRKLQTLDFSRTGVAELPQGIDELISLECLRVSYKTYYPSSILLPPNIQDLGIVKCGIPELSGLLCSRCLKRLKECSISTCLLKSGDSLISGDEVEEYAFPNLEQLYLFDVKEMRVLWKGVVPAACIQNLRHLVVGECIHLKNLFTGFFQHLSNIERIEVFFCYQLEELIACSDGEGYENGSANTVTTSEIILPRLHTLILRGLSQLQSISRNKLVCVSLHHIEVVACRKLKKLPFSVDSLPNLEEIKGSTEWWEALEWDDAETMRCLQSRFQVETLRDLHFPFSVDSLPN